MLLLLWMGPHGKRMCHAFKLFKGGEFQCSFPTKVWRPKRAGSSTDPAQTNPIILKAVKEHYHNPDPIAYLIGKVNEAHILVDDVECLALIDSGGQLLTITTKFVKQLGLKIHQLDRILRFGSTEEGDIPYGGYVEVNLKIPEIKAFNEDVLMLVIEDSAYAQCVPLQLGMLHIDRALDLISNKEIKTWSTKWK